MKLATTKGKSRRDIATLAAVLRRPAWNCPLLRTITQPDVRIPTKDTKHETAAREQIEGDLRALITARQAKLKQAIQNQVQIQKLLHANYFLELTTTILECYAKAVKPTLPNLEALCLRPGTYMLKICKYMQVLCHTVDGEKRQALFEGSKKRWRKCVKILGNRLGRMKSVSRQLVEQFHEQTETINGLLQVTGLEFDLEENVTVDFSLAESAEEPEEELTTSTISSKSN
jgi:hypothetical protein